LRSEEDTRLEHVTKGNIYFFMYMRYLQDFDSRMNTSL